MNRLIQLLDYEPGAFERVFLCYDQDGGSTLPQVAASWDAAARQVLAHHPLLRRQACNCHSLNALQVTVTSARAVG